MKLLERILDAYVIANKAKCKPNFVKRTTDYKFPNEEVLTREQILGSAEFTGFSDGFQGLPNRFEGPAGTPKNNKKI